MRKRLAIITTHPIQYNAPLFKLLADRSNIDIKVFYTFSQSQYGGQYDTGFGKIIKWDIPLLEGYDHEFIKNIAKKPGTYHFSGINNPTLNRSVEEWKPDAILIFGWSFRSHLKCIRHFHKKIPVLFRGDSTLLDNRNTLKKVIRNIFLKWVYRHIDYALYVGAANKSYYLQNGLNEDQLYFAPHAIDNDRFSKDEQLLEHRAQLKRVELGISKNDIVFLFAGKLEPKKNPGLLINAFQKIGQAAHLVIVGNGILERELKEISGAKNLHFIDFLNQTEMPVVYRMGDVFVLPSQGPGETWGLAVNEAMASGRPVIVSDKCGCAIDLVENEKNGYLFKSNDELDLLNKMKLMLDNANLNVMGQNSKHIIQDWTFEKICYQIENILFKTAASK